MDRRRSTNRRRFLKGAGRAAVAGLAGCLGGESTVAPARISEFPSH
ncbi:twin-arginine translocation signal domain-containing protein [Natrarchaeobaculum aegyptiacum]